jgi:hypothetical protein
MRWISFALVGAAASAGADPKPIPAGTYVCQIDSGYKFRACEVAKRGDEIVLVINGGLFSIEGPLRQKGDWILVDAHLTDKRPFGCYRCDERCTTAPSECVCTENPPDVSHACVVQPVYGVLKPSAGAWRGAVVFQHYDQPRSATAVERTTEVYDLTIRRR